MKALRVIGNALVDWWYSWVTLTLINVVWVACCVTVVLAPPATFALFYAAHDLVQGRGVSLGDFARGIRLYFVKSWLWGVLNIVAAVLFYANLRFYGSIEAQWSALVLMLSLALLVLWIMVQIYTVAYIMFQEQPSLRTALRNGLFTLLASPIYSLIMALFVGAVIFLSVNIVVVTLIGGPALISVLGNRAIRERLATFNILPYPTAGIPEEAESSEAS